MSRGGLLVLLLIAAVAAAGSWWFLENFEKRPIETWVGYRGEARSNPLLAARRFLKEMGIPAESVDLLRAVDEPPPPEASLVIGTERQTLGEARAQALLAWVGQGGHLIVTPARPTLDEDGLPLERARDALLDPLGISVYYEAAADETQEDIPAMTLEVEGRERPLEVDFDPYWALDGGDAADATLEDDYGVHLLRRPVGAGQLTVLSDLDFLSNARIGDHDHAEFLWRMLHPSARVPAAVFLVHDEDMPPLWRWLWEHAMPVVVSAALLLLAWLAARAPRFGALRRVPPPARRRLLEHIEAGGQFLWRQGEQARLLASVRAALERRLMLVHPGWGELRAPEREQRLAQLSALPAAQVHELLHREDFRHAHDFARVIRQLEDLRKQL